mmetsp:Transcript_27260/g.53595  ORF Transcript_27260/g.53595 Transcript_27260/m.53595 type:complete len:269 (+) Transcript_27260:559-1365(+)
MDFAGSVVNDLDDLALLLIPGEVVGVRCVLEGLLDDGKVWAKGHFTLVAELLRIGEGPRFVHLANHVVHCGFDRLQLPLIGSVLLACGFQSFLEAACHSLEHADLFCNSGGDHDAKDLCHTRANRNRTGKDRQKGCHLEQDRSGYLQVVAFVHGLVTLLFQVGKQQFCLVHDVGLEVDLDLHLGDQALPFVAEFVQPARALGFGFVQGHEQDKGGDVFVPDVQGLVRHQVENGLLLLLNVAQLDLHLLLAFLELVQTFCYLLQHASVT